MGVGDLLTKPGQVQYGDLLLGRGTAYRWATLTGWAELPALDSGTVLRAGAHGGIPGQLFAQTRTVGLSGMVVRSPAARIGGTVGALEAGTVPRETELPLAVWTDERGPLVVWARCVRRMLPVGKHYNSGTLVGGELEFVAADPRRYSPTEETSTGRLPIPEPGLYWDPVPDGSQQLDAATRAGLGPLGGWYAEQGTLSLSGDAVMFEVTAAGAIVVWPLPDTVGYPIAAGQTAQWDAESLPAGARLQLHWVDAAGALLSVADGVEGVPTLTGTAPAGAAGVRPVMAWAAVPSPARQWVGPSRLWVPAPDGYGLDWPLVFGAAGYSGGLAARNDGTADTHPVITFRGPVTRPALTNIDTGHVLEYDLPLAAGDTLTVDTAAGTVLLNGSASRIYTATGRSAPERTFALPPGPSDMTFRAAPGSDDPDASVTLRWRHAWW